MAALDQRQRELDDQATAFELERSELQNMRLRLVQEGKKLKQERVKIEQDKQALAKARQQLETQPQPQQPQPATPSQETPGSPGQPPEALGPLRARLDRQQKRIEDHRRKLEHAWAKIKKEKAALIKQKQVLQAKQRAVEDAQGPLVARSPASGQTDLKLQMQYNQLRANKAAVDMARQQYAELLEQQQILVEAKRFLASCEEEMVRRWSVHRGMGLVGGVVSCLLLLILFSYGVGHRVVNPVWRATTVVGVAATVFDESSYADAWITDNHQLLVGDRLLGEAIRLSAQRGVRIFSDESQMREVLSQGLSLGLQAPGRMVIELRHTNPQLVIHALEALARAFVNHHTEEDRASGRPNSIRIYEAAARDPQPVEDRRMAASLVTFAVSATLVALTALVLRWWLSRSVRVFAAQSIPELEQLEDSDLWPTEPAQENHNNDLPEEEGPEQEHDDEDSEALDPDALEAALEDDDDDQPVAEFDDEQENAAA